MMNHLIELKKDLGTTQTVESVIPEMGDAVTTWEDSFLQITRAVRLMLRKLDQRFSEDRFVENTESLEGMVKKAAPYYAIDIHTRRSSKRIRPSDYAWLGERFDRGSKVTIHAWIDKASRNAKDFLALGGEPNQVF